jgi:hypothetical protein
VSEAAQVERAAERNRARTRPIDIWVDKALMAAVLTVTAVLV